MKIVCPQCGHEADKSISAVNRARRANAPIYCDRTCAGVARRKNKSAAQRKAEKRLYDMEYRRKHRAALKAKKAEYYRRTCDREKERARRKANMARHVEYCRRPEYRAKKHVYDKNRYHREAYGPLADVSMLLGDLNREIKERTSDYEIRRQNETGNKQQERARAAPEVGEV